MPSQPFPQLAVPSHETWVPFVVEQWLLELCRVAPPPTLSYAFRDAE
jgi:hypothetical protein